MAARCVACSWGVEREQAAWGKLFEALDKGLALGIVAGHCDVADILWMGGNDECLSGEQKTKGGAIFE